MRAAERGWTRPLECMVPPMPSRACAPSFAAADPIFYERRRPTVTATQLLCRTTETAGAPVHVQRFEAGLRGELLRPETAAYETARRVHNAMIDKRPALIVRCAGVSDVVNAVKFARENDLLVAIRGGGHNVAGTAVCDGGIVI